MINYNAIVPVIIGILLVLIHSTLMRFFGLAPNSSMDLDGALYGSELILMGLICWFARDVSEPRTQRGLITAFTIANFISLVLSAIGLVRHTFCSVGWIAVVFYAILTVVYGYYWVTLPREATEIRQMEQHTEATH